MSLARGGSGDAVIWNVAEQAIASLGQTHRDGLVGEARPSHAERGARR